MSNVPKRDVHHPAVIRKWLENIRSGWWVAVRFGTLPAQPEGEGRAPGPSGSRETAEGCATETTTSSEQHATIEKAPFPGLFP
jgi:hypothetical protein